MSKVPKTLSNCLKRTETSVDLIVFYCVLCEVSAHKLIRFNLAITLILFVLASNNLSFNILFENKNQSKTIRVTCKMMVSHV